MSRIILGLMCAAALFATCSAEAVILDIFGNIIDPRDPAPGADFRNADLPFADLRGLDLTGANFSNANLDGADLSGATFANANLFRANISDATAVDADFRGIITGSDVSFRRTTLRGSTFAGSFLSDVDFGCFFCGSDDRTDLRNVNFSSVVFEYIAITQGDMSGANLQNATFLDGGAIEFSELIDADLRGTIDDQGRLFSSGLGNNFTGALYDATTIYRSTFDPNAEGMIFIPGPAAAWLVVCFGCFARFRDVACSSTR